MKRWTCWLFLSFLLGLLVVGCGGGSKPATVTILISPTGATVVVKLTQQFFVQVSGASDTTVKWFVNDKEGGDIATTGSISTTGLFTAPDNVPNPATVTVKATANAAPKPSATATVTIDSGIQVSIAPATATVGTGETFQFFATVKNTSNTNVTWTIDPAASGTISATGLYTAPTTLPSSTTVTVKATSVADTTRSATATVTLVTAADPTLTAINPTSAAQGSAFQDVYLAGTNFISTTTVRANGTAVPATPVTSLLLRARIPDCLLSTAGTLSIDVRRQNGTTTAAKTFTVSPVRPALVAASPDSATQTLGGATVSFNVNGGYYGTSGPCAPPTSPAVTAEFDGNVRTTSVTSRQLSVTIGGGNSDLSTPGLFSVAVRNSGAAQPVAVTNLAVQPSPSVTAPSVVATLPVGMKPGAVAVNTATGIAVVTNHDSNTISLIDLTTSPPTISGTPIAVGTSPTGVAVDTVRNLAVVANNGSNSVSIIDLRTGTNVPGSPITGNINAQPFSVGVNPQTGQALVVYQSTNNGSLLDLTASPPVVTGSVSISTGPNPQVAVEPRLNWAIATPGGAGSFSIVDLGRQSVNTIAAAPNGASRSTNVVTITTTATHGLIPSEAVLITGVADTSFNGTFTVAAVPSGTTFSYNQTGPNVTSGGGSVSYALPLVNATLGIGVRGIGLNTVTEKALLADPTTNTLQIFSLLDQSILPLPLPETGAVAAAVNPLIDIGVTINPGLGAGPGTASVIDPRTPVRIATVSVGTGPKAVAIDPGSNLALVANEGSNNVTIISLGNIRSLQITESSPAFTFISSDVVTPPLTLTLNGTGFAAGSAVRLDGDSTGVTTSFDATHPRRLTATILPSRLGAPRRYAVDVLNPGGVHSNVSDLTVIQTVKVTSTGCTAPMPRGVAIDPERNLAVVTNPGCNNISLIDMTTGTVSKTIAVGTNPQGVAVISRLSKAVVTNRGSNNASVVDLAGGTVATTVLTGAEPIGVAINQDTATAVVANSLSNTISTFNADTGSLGATASVDTRPVAVAIDPTRNIAAVACATQNTLDLVDLSQASAPVTGRIQGLQLPTGVVFDPEFRQFLALSSLGNRLFLVNPVTQQPLAPSVGVNPTALAYNFQSRTLVIANTASKTVSVIDLFHLDLSVRAILGSNVAPQCLNPILAGTPPVQQQPTCGVDIHPRTNLAVFADGDNNRVLLVPLPR